MPSARKSNRTDQQKKELKRGGVFGYGTENIASIVTRENLVTEVLTERSYNNLITQSDIDGIKYSLAIDKNTITIITTNYKDALIPFLQFKILMKYLKNNTKILNNDTNKKILIIQKLVELLQEVVTKVQTALGDGEEDEEGAGEEDEEGEPNLDELYNTALEAISNARSRIEQSQQLEDKDKETMKNLVDNLNNQLDNDNIQPKDIQKIIEDANTIAIPATANGGKKSKRNGGGRCVMSPEMTKILTTGHLF